MKFCGKCATPLSPRCPECGFENPLGFAFCGQCGGPLTTQPTVQSKHAKSKAKSAPKSTTRKKRSQTKRQVAEEPRPVASEAERRQLTVMFCDLVDSTTLSAQLDPEEWREVVRAYQQTSADVIERFDGHIAQYLGDGLLVYFGYPAAHEDDATRAVRVGLELVEAIRGWRSGTGAQEKHSRLIPRLSQPLQIRIGIHTGPVVVGEMGGGAKREQLALGETPNIAARIQGQADPNTVVISATTYRLVEGLFECEDRGQPALKGVTTPLILYRVLKEGEAQSRFQVVARKGLTPLVGREHEFGLLRERWERVRDGEGQVVLLSGEPGIGKSRLVEALKDSLKHEGVSCLELRCSPYHQNSALYPVLEHLQRVLQFQPTDSSEQKLEKLEQRLSRSRLDPKETVPLLASAIIGLLVVTSCSTLLTSRFRSTKAEREVPRSARRLALYRGTAAGRDVRVGGCALGRSVYSRIVHALFGASADDPNAGRTDLSAGVYVAVGIPLLSQPDSPQSVEPGSGGTDDREGYRWQDAARRGRAPDRA